MPIRICDVTVYTPDGHPHTITVEAQSVFWAAINFFTRSRTPQPGESLPRTDDDTVFEVRPVFRIRQRELLLWANRLAQRTNRKG